jgi:transcriptional regulator GlxA family with amidase domain
VTDVLFILFDGIQSLDLTGPLDAFAGANEWCQSRGEPHRYVLRTASLGGAVVRSSSGLIITPDADLAMTERPPDLLVVPGGEGARRRDPELVAWLRAHAPRAKRLASVCTGAFLLAEAGLVKGRRVTTHWAYCAMLAAEYPDLVVDSEPIFVRDGPVSTSGGVTSGIDLGLALVEEDLGHDAALSVARDLVVFLRRPGNQVQFKNQLIVKVASQDRLRDVQLWIAEHPEANLSVRALASRAGMSARHFSRAFAVDTGLPPGQYVDRTRIEAARRCLEDTTRRIEEVSRTCGYGTAESMRRAFIRTLGMSPVEYRRRFCR